MQGLVKGEEGTVDLEIVDITRDRDASSRYKIQVTPTIIVFDAAGNQVKTFVGVPRESDLKAAIEKALAS